MSPLPPPPAYPVHAGVPEQIHLALCLRPGCHLLRHACVPSSPLTPRRRVLLHPEVLPSGVQVTAAFLIWWVMFGSRGRRSFAMAVWFICLSYPHKGNSHASQKLEEIANRNGGNAHMLHSSYPNCFPGRWVRSGIARAGETVFEPFIHLFQNASHEDCMIPGAKLT